MLKYGAFSTLLLFFYVCITSVQAAVLVKSDTTMLTLREHIEVLEDSTGKLTFADIEHGASSAAFHSVTGESELNFGYTRSSYWLRLTLLPHIPSPSSWLLEIAYPSLDEVDFYRLCHR